jgi:hypothetical protein
LITAESETLAGALRDELKRADPLAPADWWAVAAFDEVLAGDRRGDPMFDEVDGQHTNGTLYVLLGQFLAGRAADR